MADTTVRIRFTGDAREATRAASALNTALRDVGKTGETTSRKLHDTFTGADSSHLVRETRAANTALSRTGKEAGQIKRQLTGVFSEADSRKLVAETNQAASAMEKTEGVAGRLRRSLAGAFRTDSRQAVSEAHQFQRALADVDDAAEKVKRELRAAFDADTDAGVAELRKLGRAIEAVDREAEKARKDIQRGLDGIDGNKASRELGGVRRSIGQVGDDAERQGSRISRAFATAGRGIGVAFKAGAIAAGAALVGLALAARRAVGAAVDLGEQINKTRVVFGQGARDVLAFSTTTARSLGIARAAALEAAGTFGNMLVPMGFAREEAAKMSVRFVQLAADLASFNNADPSEVLEALRAGLAGETEPLRRFGVFLNEARIQSEAFALGLTKGADAARSAADAQEAAQKKVTAATKAQEQSAKRLAAAQKAVGAAHERVLRSLEAYRTSTQRLADAQERTRDAAQKVKDAQLALRDAQVRSKDAQVALTEARRDAKEALDDLRVSTRDAILGEERAEIALIRARERLIEVNRDSKASEIDRREAALGVREAEASVDEAHRRRITSQRDLNKAEREGIAGSRQVRDATREVAAANKDAAVAARAVKEATEDLVRAQRDVENAHRGVEAAQRRLTQARNDETAAEAAVVAAQKDSKTSSADLEAAQDALALAKKRVAAAGGEVSKTLTAQQKAMAIYAIILKDTNDAQGDFGDTSESLANQQRILKARWIDLAAALGAILLPAVSAAVEALQRFLGFLSQVSQAKGLEATISVVLAPVEGVLADARDLGARIATAIQNKVSESGGWQQVGQRIGRAIGDSIVISTDTAARLIGQLIAAINANRGALAQAGAALALAVVATLVDPAFWLSHWKEIAAIALVAGTGPLGALGRAIAGRIGLALGVGLRGVGARAAAVILAGLGRLPGSAGVIAQAAARAIGRAFVGVAGVVTRNLSGVRRAILGAFALGGLVAAVRGIGSSLGSALAGGISAALRGLGRTVRAFVVGPINAIIDGINRIRIPSFRIHINMPAPIPDVNFATPAIDPVPTVPRLALGGIVSRPTLAMIGEQGPEAVIPLNHRQAGLGMTVNLNINGPVYGDPRRFAREIRDLVLPELRRYERRNSSVGFGST